MMNLTKSTPQRLQTDTLVSLIIIVPVCIAVFCYWIFFLPTYSNSQELESADPKTDNIDLESAPLLELEYTRKVEVTKQKKKKSRHWILDNAKFIVMCHVLLGHFLITSTAVDPSSTPLGVVRTWFKAWHDYSLSFQITVFAFISGAVSKRGGDVVQSIHKLLIFVAGPMFFMYTFLFLTYNIWKNPKQEPSPFNPVSFGANDWPVTPLWYLASLISWRLLLLMFGSIENSLLLPLSVIISLAGGYWGGIGSDEIGEMVKKFAKESAVTDQVVLRSNTIMAFERTMGNFPFFIAGVVLWPMLNAWLEQHTQKEWPKNSKKKWLVPLAGALFAIFLAFVACWTHISTSAYMIYGKFYQNNYLGGWLRQYGERHLPNNIEWNLMWTRRLMYLIVSSLLGLCNTLWLPTFKIPWISESGAHSMYPYVLQVTCLTVWTHVRDALILGEHKEISPTSGWWVIIFFVQPLFVLLLSSRCVRFLFWPLVEPYWLNMFTANRSNLPWKHPELEKHWEKNTAMHMFRVVFWIFMIVATFLRLLTPHQWFSGS